MKSGEKDIIKNKIQSFEADVPDFNSLFSNEELDNCTLKNSLSRVKSFSSDNIPEYNVLFPKKGLLIKFRKISIAASAAAAVIILLLLAGSNLFTNKQVSTNIASVKEDGFTVEEQAEKIDGEKIKALENIHPAAIAKNTRKTISSPQKSASLIPVQKNLQNLKKDSIKTDKKTTPLQNDKGLSKCDIPDTITENKTAKIADREIISDSEYATISVEEAYKIAKEKEKKKRKGLIKKLNTGINLNRGSNLLSFLNTINGKNSLRSNDGGSSIFDGSSSPLRTATSSKNEWKMPDNLSETTLKKYKAEYDMPFSFGLSLSFPLFSIFNLNTGLYYTYLHAETKGETTDSKNFTLDQNLHYIGIPAQISARIHEGNRLGLYVGFGGALEKGITGKQRCKIDGESTWTSSQEIEGFQPVVTGSIGLTYRITKPIFIYVEPALNYYPDTDQPISTRTDQPYNFNINIGVRYSFK